MAPSHDRPSKQGWTPIAIGLLFFTVLQAGAVVAYVFFIFEARYTCDRARDSCQVEHVGMFSREVIRQFRPSQLIKADSVHGKGASYIALEMADGAPEVRIGTRLREERREVVTLFSDFITHPAQPELHHVVKAYHRHYILIGVLQSLAFVILVAVWSAASKKLSPR